MKKLIMLLIIALILVMIGISGRNIVQDDTEYEMYIPIDAKIPSDVDADIIDAGSFKIVRMDSRHRARMVESIPHIYGESVRLHGDRERAEAIVRRYAITIYDDDNENGTHVIRGYSPMLDKTIQHNGKSVNIELKYGNNTIQIGTPLIMGSY